jgi:glycerate kinase
VALPRVLIAPDSFKGTFNAVAVAAAISRGLERAGLEADRCPVADGGEGTVQVLLASLGGRLVEAPAHDPLGRELQASFALLGENGALALVEASAASGLALLAADELDPWRADTYGTGELIAAAIAAGARNVMVAVGGSATVDGGRGALEAIAEHGGTGAAQIVVLCDVQTTWEQCAEIYGPQKGADPEMVRRLAARLDAYAAELPRDPRGIPTTGAAGGLSGGLWAEAGAELRPGAPYVLDALSFDARLRSADAVVAGEGRLDRQSLMGKIVGEIAARAREAGVPLHAVVGKSQIDPESAKRIALRSITEATTLAELEAAGEHLARMLTGAPPAGAPERRRAAGHGDSLAHLGQRADPRRPSP